ncbi:hypothetical protein Fcan01_23213 [Folsomia candida]|uniref:Uncharacterized protein n=1 Tax=Folsomia candida TaxID=158441 RepID=A0A226DBI4_FOLCA|nr:hypothetical protein Fcan01_23213 [Folsomia candida]
MRPKNLTLSALCLSIFVARNIYTINLVEPFSFSDLLQNLRNCDVQIIHSGNFNIQMATRDWTVIYKTVFMPPYETVKCMRVYQLKKILPLNIISSRVSPCQLSLIFDADIGKKCFKSIKNRLKYWTNVASTYSHYYENFSTFFPSRASVNTNGEITLITTKPSQNFVEICFVSGTEVLQKFTGTTRCLPAIHLIGQSYLSAVGKLALPTELWCSSNKAFNKLTLNLFLRENEGYQFLTCYTESYISFDFYFTPFQPEYWLVLAISTATIGIVTTIVLHLLHAKQKQSFSPWVFLLASLFDESGFMPDSIEKATFFRISLGVWSLVSVTLTNSYNGIMIGELNAPRKNTPGFRDLNHFVSNHAFFPRGFTYLNFTRVEHQRQVERDVVQCGKTVFVGTSPNIKMEHEFLSRKYLLKTFFISDQIIQNFPRGLVFQYPWRSKVVKDFKSIIKAGIWTHVENKEIRRQNANRTAALVPERADDLAPTNIATWSGALPTLFILVGGLISVTILGFMVECRSYFSLLVGKIRRKFVSRRYWKSKKQLASSKCLMCVNE